MPQDVVKEVASEIVKQQKILNNLKYKYIFMHIPTKCGPVVPLKG